jgi:type VI secretion system protein ImpM
VAITGFFGKVPTRGDFVRRALPATFVTPWDAWLQAGIADIREILGEAWLDIYLTSPVWRFALSSELVGTPAVAGVLMPSVDRVGRYFPFTLACVLDGAPAPMQLRAESDWFQRAETLALGVLAEDSSLDELIAGLVALGCPAPPAPIPLDDGAWRFDGAAKPLTQALVARFALPHALFWTQGSTRVRPTTLFVRQLPSARQFAALLDGAWSEHGWCEAAP